MDLLITVATCTLCYGMTMGSIKHRNERTCGVTPGMIYAALLCGLAGLISWAAPLGCLVAWRTNTRLSWQMHRSYPTDPRYVDIYIQLYGRIR